MVSTGSISDEARKVDNTATISLDSRMTLKITPAHLNHWTNFCCTKYEKVAFISQKIALKMAFLSITKAEVKRG